jgi:hypothetical protein
MFLKTQSAMMNIFIQMILLLPKSDLIFLQDEKPKMRDWNL